MYLTLWFAGFVSNPAHLNRPLLIPLLTLGLRFHESVEGLVVTRTDRCELHTDSLSSFRPPHDSLRTYSGQLGRLTKDQVKLSTDGEHFLRAEAQPRFAHVFGIHDVVSRPFRKGYSQRCDEPFSWLLFL